MLHRFTGLMVLALAAAAAASAAGEPKPDPAYQAAVNQVKQKLGQSFTVKQVGVFVVAWDLDAAKGAEYDRMILTVQDALYENFFVNRPKGIFKVAIFRDNASLQKNAKKLAVKSAVMPMGGFYLPYEKVICAEAAMGAWGVQHEVTHALLHADFGREDWPSSKLTPWIDEGMASLMESAVIDGKDIRIRLDWRLRVVHQVMKEQKRFDGLTAPSKVEGLPRLKDVLKMDFATYNSPQNRMLCDAMARNLLFYLHEKGLLMGFYKLYRANYGADPSGVKFIEQVTKKDINAVEADWLAWIDETTAKAAAE